MAKQRARRRNESPGPELPARDEFLLKAFADVAPLKGRRRVAPKPDETARPRLHLRDFERPNVVAPGTRFVTERDDDHVSGYRSDLGPSVLAPLRSSRWQPQGTLDLHGCRIRDLEKELLPELSRRVGRGSRRLLIVHGKGLHSTGGIGVLASAVVDLLSERHAMALVRAFMTAPLRLGGSGALAIELDVPRKPR